VEQKFGFVQIFEFWTGFGQKFGPNILVEGHPGLRAHKISAHVLPRFSHISTVKYLAEKVIASQPDILQTSVLVS